MPTWRPYHIPVHLERWVVDEILDGDVRVLRADLRAEASLPDAVLAAFAAQDRTAEAAREGVRAAAVELEASPAATWSEEVEVLVDYPAVAAFLLGGARRTGRPGLPNRDELREGDVYLVVHPEEPELVAPYEQRPARTPDETTGLLEAWEATGAEVWDVTAASRQVMKRLYGDALFARPAERSAPDDTSRG